MIGRHLGIDEPPETRAYRAPRGALKVTPLIIAEGTVELSDLPNCDLCPPDTQRACNAAVRDYKPFARAECNKALAKPPSAAIEATGQLSLPFPTEER